MVDWSNPCARAEALRAAYYALLSGAQEQRVRIGDQEVTFQASSLAALKTELQTAERECGAQQGGRPQRFAITAGSRRRTF